MNERIDKMDRLDITAVSRLFGILAQLTEEETSVYLPTVKSGMAYFDRLFLRDYADEAEKQLSEYACACKVFFDYTVLKAAIPKTYSTQSGGIFAKVSDDAAVKNAAALMRRAMAALPKGLISDDGFVFEGVAG